MTSRTLYILCGGQSRRMGQDKALLEINGKSLLEYWIQRASHLFSEVVLLSSTARYETSSRQLEDLIYDTGPLSGLLAAMKDEKGKGDFFTIVAVDIPNLKESTLELLATKTPEESRLLIASCGEEIQPLTGIYHRNLAKELTGYLKTGRRSVMGFLEKTDPEYFNVNEEELLNINKPDTWSDFLRLHASRFNDPAS